MDTVRLTVAQAVVRFLTAQRTEVDGQELPLFPGVFAIFGHGNVTCLGEALAQVQDVLPTWRGQNEQSMALAAIAFAKATRRRQVMVATSSIVPGATNMLTAAGVAHANRLPLLMLAGDTFANRLPDPVLQQVERFDDPTVTVNDAFKPLTRYWDRIVRPEQLLQSLPQAIGVLLDPADCGPVLLALPQDIQAEAFDFPVRFFEKKVHGVSRPRPDRRQVETAAALIRSSRRPMLVAGGGVHYSLAEQALADFAAMFGVPVVETMAGKGSLPWDHAHNVGPLGVTGGTAANALAADADVVIAVGTRLGDFATGSWSAFQNDGMRLVTINVGRFDSRKHRAVSVVGDALESLGELTDALVGWKAPAELMRRATAEVAKWNSYTDSVRDRHAVTATGLPSYAQVIGAVQEVTGPDDYAVSAAGGLPGELNKNWRVRSVGAFDCEFGFSCMGYEVAGAWGAKMALPDRHVVTFCGDGSYLMHNSDIYSSVLSGHKFTVVLCDNGGFSVIQRLQEHQGGEPFNNRYDQGTRRAVAVEVDFAAHAAALGAIAERVDSLDELKAAVGRARVADRTSVIVIRTDPFTWTAGDAWWDVGVPEVSVRAEVLTAKAAHEAERKHQRVGV